MVCCSRADANDPGAVWGGGVHRHPVDAEHAPQLLVVVLWPRRRLCLLLGLCYHRPRQLHPHHSTGVP